MYLSRSVLTFICVLVTCPFWASAIIKAAYFEDTLAEFVAMGLPTPALIAVTTILVQAGGSVSLITGTLAPIGTALLAIFSLAASFVAHDFWSMPEDAFVPNFAAFTANIGLIGGLISVALLINLFKERYR